MMFSNVWTFDEGSKKQMLQTIKSLHVDSVTVDGALFGEEEE